MTRKPRLSDERLSRFIRRGVLIDEEDKLVTSIFQCLHAADEVAEFLANDP